MYQFIFKQQLRKGFENISRADFDAVLDVFALQVHFTFIGEHAMSADVTSRDLVRAWFERVHRLFPDLRVTPRQIRVSGWPWDVTAVTQFDVHASLPDKSAYTNQGVQIVRIRWGKVVEDYLIEDTQLLTAALARVAESGNREAVAVPIG